MRLFVYILSVDIYILILHIHFRNLDLTPTDKARNLRVIFDSGFDFKSRISGICKIFFFPHSSTWPSAIIT